MKRIPGIFHLIPILLIFVIFIFPLLKPGLIVGGDWTFPATNNQLHVFANEGLSLWSNREIPTGSQIAHQNLYLLQVLAGLWANTGLDGIGFQKTILFITLFGIYFFSYIFLFRFTKNKFSSTIGALSYLFSPIVFNYLNMGWNYVLLFLALQPLFCLLAYNYFQLGGTKRIIALGFISAIGLFQSQSIVWFLILYLILFLSHFKFSNVKQIVTRFILGIFAIIVTTLLIHLPWILPILSKLDYSFISTTPYDVTRFSAVTSLLNSYRVWGSLFNQQFELSFPDSLLLFSYFPITLIIYRFIVSKNKKQLQIKNLVLGLILVAPTIYFFRDSIARLPYSSIIRDGSRFLVITSLGVSLGIAMSLRNTANKKIIIGIIICLLLSAYPFFSGKLYWIKDNPISSANTYKDFRLKLLDIPEKKNENIFQKYENQRNLFMPTGGFIFTKIDTRFSRSFWGIADTQARFSPYGSGIYNSDKSNPLVANFTKNYLEAANSWMSLNKISRIYGIEHLFYRKGLISTLTYPIDDPNNNPFCKATNVASSDWSITSICTIENVYPLFYTSASPQYTTASLSGILKRANLTNNYLTITGCPEYLNLDASPCTASLPGMAVTTPKLLVEKINNTQYLVRIEKITGNFVLAFNQTYHPGWRLTQKTDNIIVNSHLLINQLVNGWLITPKSSDSTMEFMIEFYPQLLYSRLIPWSLAIFGILSVYLTMSFIPKKHEKP